MLLLAACTATTPDDSGATSPAGDTATHTGDTADSGDASDTSDSTDTSDTSDTSDTADSTADTADSGSSTPTVLIPLYVYPVAGAWDGVVTAAESHPDGRVIAIVNVNSSPYVGGPDSPSAALEPGYAASIPALASAGVTVLGYVPTGYAARSSTDVLAMAQAWRTLYPDVAGIFLDEMSSAAGDVPYYQTIAAGIAAIPGLGEVLANPGVVPDAAYAGVFDGIVIYESPGLPPGTALSTPIPPAERGVLAYGVSAVDTTWIRETRTATGYLYVTPDELPNPWDTVSPLLDTLLSP